MTIKMVLADMDGTLLTSQKQLSPRNRAALEMAASRGVQVVPATGRYYMGIPEAVRSLPFVRYCILVNGAQVYDAHEDKTLFRADLTLERAEFLFDRLEQLPVIFDCYIDGQGYMEEASYARIDEFVRDPAMAKVVRSMRIPVKDFRAFVREKATSVQKVQAFFPDHAAMAAAMESLRPDCPDLSMTSSIGTNLEINHKDATKGNALRFLCKHLGIYPAETVAFGDGTNDISMIKAAGFGYAMANSPEKVLDAAEMIAESNDDDGIAKVLEQLIAPVRSCSGCSGQLSCGGCSGCASARPR